MKEVSINYNSFCLKKHLLAHMNIIMEHAPVWRRHDVWCFLMYFFTLSASKQQDYMLEQIDFEFFQL